MAIAGIVVGFIVRVIPAGIANGFTLVGICSSAPGWYVYTLLGPVAAFAVTWGVSLATQKVCPSNEYGFHFNENGTPILKADLDVATAINS